MAASATFSQRSMLSVERFLHNICIFAGYGGVGALWRAWMCVILVGFRVCVRGGDVNFGLIWMFPCVVITYICSIAPLRGLRADKSAPTKETPRLPGWAGGQVRPYGGSWRFPGRNRPPGWNKPPIPSL